MTALSAQYTKLYKLTADAKSVKKSAGAAPKGAAAVKKSDESDADSLVHAAVHAAVGSAGVTNVVAPMTHASSKMKTTGEASAAHTKLVAQAKRTASTKTPSKPNTIHPLAKPGSKWPTMKTSSTPNGIHPLAKPGSKWPTLAPASTHAKQTTAPEVVNEPLDRAEQMM